MQKNQSNYIFMDSYFRSPHWFWWSIIPLGMTLTAWIAFCTLGYALWQTWITTALPQSLFQWIFWLALLTHVGEALYALQLARRISSAHVFRWTLQTFWLGYPSLSLLKKRLEQSRHE